MRSIRAWATYILSQAFENALREAGSSRHVVGLVTQVEVDADDPGFRQPTKPVGPYFNASEAEALTREFGVTMKEEGGRGWRYVVPSPVPLHVCDISLVEALMCTRTVVIAGGGGGIPVVRDSMGRRHGVEAVIDKDLTAALMASILGIHDMMILTAVPRVAVHFGKPEQRELVRVGVSEMRRYQAEGHFPPGSMGPRPSFAFRSGRRAPDAAPKASSAASRRCRCCARPGTTGTKRPAICSTWSRRRVPRSAAAITSRRSQC